MGMSCRLHHSKVQGFILLLKDGVRNGRAMCYGTPTRNKKEAVSRKSIRRGTTCSSSEVVARKSIRRGTGASSMGSRKMNQIIMNMKANSASTSTVIKSEPSRVKGMGSELFGRKKHVAG